MLLQKLLTFSVAKAEVHGINLVKRHLVGEPQVSIADESLVYIRYQIACITLRVGKDNLGIRVIQ